MVSDFRSRSISSQLERAEKENVRRQKRSRSAAGLGSWRWIMFGNTVGIRSHIWACGVTFGHSGSHLGTRGHIWVHRVTFGFIGSHLRTQGHIWTYNIISGNSVVFAKKAGKVRLHDFYHSITFHALEPRISQLSYNHSFVCLD